MASAACSGVGLDASTVVALLSRVPRLVNTEAAWLWVASHACACNTRHTPLSSQSPPLVGTRHSSEVFSSSEKIWSWPWKTPFRLPYDDTNTPAALVVPADGL